MSKKSNFTPNEPFVPKKQEHISAPTPRPARVLARVMLLILVILAIILVIVTIRDLKDRSSPERLSNTAAIGRLVDYAEGDMINLDQFICDHGYRPTGANQEFVYERDGQKISIQCYPETGQVNVGDANGNTSTFGTSDKMFICRLSWLYEYGEARSVVENPGMCDIQLSHEALAQIVRLVLR